MKPEMTTGTVTNEEEPEVNRGDTKAEQAQHGPSTIIGPNGDPIPITKDIRITLGIEKFRRPNKHYRLIWVAGSLAWLYEEVPVEFRRKQDAVTVGAELAKRIGVRFSELTR